MSNFEVKNLIPLIESEIASLKEVQQEGDYTDVEVFLSDLEGTLNIILKALRGELLVR